MSEVAGRRPGWFGNHGSGFGGWLDTNVIEDLRRLGVADGDVVMVHASLRRIGPVEGRAEGLVAALDGAVGPAGTRLMMTSAQDDWSWVNERPEAEREELLAGADPFDYVTTPSDPENGVLAEVFRRASGSISSNHPEGRFSARGLLADELVRDVPWDDYYGPGSPLQRLVDAGGKVLRLGADVETVTLLHYAEYLADVPQKRRVRRFRRVRTATGVATCPVECLDDAQGIVERTGPDYFGLILNAYLETGRGQRGQVGRAASELLDAADLTGFGASWMTEHWGDRRPPQRVS